MNSQNPKSNPLRLILTIIVLVIVVVVTINFFNGRDNRTGGQRFGDVVDSVSNGNSVNDSLDRAKDRTPAQKIGDDLKDEGKKFNNDVKNR